MGRGEWTSLRKEGCRLYHQGARPKPERNSAGWQASTYAARGAGNLTSFCIALMRPIKSQCSAVSRSRMTLENGSVVLAYPEISRGAVEDWRPVTLHRPTFARRQAVTWLLIGLTNFSPYNHPFRSSSCLRNHLRSPISSHCERLGGSSASILSSPVCGWIACGFGRS